MRVLPIPEGREARRFVLAFETGEEVVAGLIRFAEQAEISGAQISGIGAFQSAKLGHFDPADRTYREIEVGEQVEVVALTGNLGPYAGKPRLHLHAVLGRPDGTTLGGHLAEGIVRPTLEVFVTVLPATLAHRRDEVTGLPLLDLPPAK